MTFASHPSILIPLAFIAEVSVMESGNPWIALGNYGVAGIVLLWFMWRDKLERQDRDRQHTENLSSQRRLENALRTNTNSNIITLLALKSVDVQFAEAIERVRHDNENPDL